MKRWNGWLIFLGVLVLSWTVVGFAPAAGAADEDKKELEEVFVTAQKKEQDLQAVPSSVVTLSDEKLCADSHAMIWRDVSDASAAAMCSRRGSLSSKPGVSMKTALRRVLVSTVTCNNASDSSVQRASSAAANSDNGTTTSSVGDVSESPEHATSRVPTHRWLRRIAAILHAIAETAPADMSSVPTGSR